MQTDRPETVDEVNREDQACRIAIDTMERLITYIIENIERLQMRRVELRHIRESLKKQDERAAIDRI